MVQDKELSTSNEKRYLGKLFWIGKFVITVLILSYIYKTFHSEQKGLTDIARVIANALSQKNLPILISMIVLVPVNWALESLKWKQLAKKVVPLTFRDSFRGILTGLAIGVAAPAQLGDTIGRIAVLKSDNRLKAIGAALVSNGMQFYISVIAGIAGWCFTREQLSLTASAKYIVDILLSATIALGIILMYTRKKLLTWFPSNTYLKKIRDYLSIIGIYNGADLAIASGYGVLRYLVFLTQFILSMSMFNFPLTHTEMISCVALIFLAKTLIPAVNVIGDLGLREFTALFVFKQYNLPPEEIITATFMIWIINVLGPILVGLFLIWKYKWRPHVNTQT